VDICSVFCGFIFSLLAARTTLTRVTAASSPVLLIQGSMRSAPVKQKTLRYLAGSSRSTRLKFQQTPYCDLLYISFRKISENNSCPIHPCNTALLPQLRKAISWAPNIAKYPTHPNSTVSLEILIFSAGQKQFPSFTELKAANLVHKRPSSDPTAF